MSTGLNAANGRLKRDRVPVRIFLREQWLYLRATLPPAPRSANREWHQQKIALRIPIRADTISIAEKKARQLGFELADGSFLWVNWQAHRSTHTADKSKSISEWIEELHSDYFLRRADTPQSRRTWKDYQFVLDRLPMSANLSADIIMDVARSTQPDSKTRQRTCMVLAMLAKFAGVEIDLSPYRGKYGKRMLIPRNLPTDQEIKEARELILDPAWQWVYGILACYGLRSHESMLCLMEFPKLDVTESGKTGSRLVYPLPESWAISWELGQVHPPNISGKDNSAIGNRISHAFKRFKIPFPPSALRHCWAIRASRHYTIEEAARMMGFNP